MRESFLAPRFPRRPAFSLLELMIAIVILGLGMVMVATIFPVAWDRARTLNEHTVRQSIISGAHATVMSLVHVSSPRPGTPSSNASSFFGDWMYDELNNNQPVFACMPPFGDWPVDTWVHALNIENLRIVDRAFIPEDLWKVEAPGFDSAFVVGLPGEIIENSFLGSTPAPGRPGEYVGHKQIAFYQRVHPPMRPRENVDADGLFTGDDESWDSALDTRRFCWALLHRFRTETQYTPGNPTANEEAQGATRSFDLYYVTLRRPRSTYRYARQDPASAPNPCDLNPNNPPAQPAARPHTEDLMLPVPWRVQVQFPDADTLQTKGDATGIPTEIEVPPTNFPGDTESRVMLVAMFPPGAWFIDEINGQVYKVVKRRITGPEPDHAFLTLDREVYVEDVTLGANDPQCGAPCEDTEFAHLRRTVWVFPPPVQADGTETAGPRIFEGSQPVVGIEIRSVKLAPSG